MYGRGKQTGITLIGFIFILIVAGFFALMAMRLVPVYVEYFGVVKAMKSVASEPGSANKSAAQLASDLGFKGSFQYVDDETLSPRNVKVERDNGQVMLVVAYDKQKHFLYNIDFLLHFKNSVALSGDAG